MKSWKPELNFGVQLADVHSPDKTQDTRQLELELECRWDPDD